MESCCYLTTALGGGGSAGGGGKDSSRDSKPRDHQRDVGVRQLRQREGWREMNNAETFFRAESFPMERSQDARSLSPGRRREAAQEIDSESPE